MAELEKKLRKRTGHRVYISQTLKVTKECLESKKYEENHDLPLSVESSLSEQLKAVQCLDEDILEILTDNVGEKDDGENILAKEITEAGSVRLEIKSHMKPKIILYIL